MLQALQSYYSALRTYLCVPRPILSHAIRLWLPPAPNPVEPLILGLPFASCPGWETIKAAAVLMAVVVASEY